MRQPEAFVRLWGSLQRTSGQLCDLVEPKTNGPNFTWTCASLPVKCLLVVLTTRVVWLPSQVQWFLNSREATLKRSSAILRVAKTGT